MPTNSRTERERKALVSWYERLRELREYRQEHGHCRVPQKCSGQQKLANWVNKVRMNRASLSMTQEQVLDALDFVWADHKGPILWNKHLVQLRAYHAVHGNCNVPTKYKVRRKRQCLQ
jgi:Helicase associated domain